MRLSLQRYLKLTLILLFLVLNVVGLFWWQGRLIQSAQSYTSFLTNTQLLPGDQLTQLSSQVIVVVIGGLGYDTLQTLDLPNIQRIRESGANALVQSTPPLVRSASLVDPHFWFEPRL